MTNYPKISIVTPCFNSEKYLEETILSVLNQNYPNLEYVIIDGGSTDNTIDIIKKYEHRLTYWNSEKDHGMYHALNKGFKKTSGEILGWINSDDLYHNKSFFSIAEIFNKYPEVKWLLGANSWIDEEGKTIEISQSRKFTQCHFFKGDFKWIQQESCLWKRDLWILAGEKLNDNLRFAGDFELWLRFFRYEELYVTNALIGGFRKSKSGQLSFENRDKYLLEVNQVLKKELSLTKRAVKRKEHIIHFDRVSQEFILREVNNRFRIKRLLSKFKNAIKDF